MCFEVVDFPGGEYADENNIKLDRLLSDNNKCLVEVLIVIESIVDTLSPLMQKIINTSFNIDFSYPSIQQKAYNKDN